MAALADPGTGLAREDARPTGRPWQEPDGGWGESSGRTDLHTTIDSTGRTADRRADFAEVYGDWAEVARIAPQARPAGRRPRASADPPSPHGRSGPARSRRSAGSGGRRAGHMRRAAQRGTGPGRDHRRARRWPCWTPTGRNSTRWPRWPTGCAGTRWATTSRYIVTRNINFTNVCYTGCRFCAFAQRRTDADAYTLSLEQVGDRAEQAWAAGATEVCMQGGIHPDLPGTAYFDIAAEVKRRCPDLHVHAFSPMEVVNGAARTGLSVREWLVRGPGGRGRLAPRHRGRDPGRRRALGADQGQAARRGLDRGHHDRARAGHPDQRDDDVRARGHARRTGSGTCG